MIQSKNTLASWFSRGRKPLAGQFADWLDSFWHKNEKIPATEIDGLSNVLDNKVSRSGDVMAGNLAVPNATADGHAVNKGQVDNAVSVLTTSINSKVSKGGDTMSGNLSIPDGTGAGHAVNKGQVDATVSGLTTAINSKVSKSGDTMSGNLTIPTGTEAGHAVNKGQLDGVASNNNAALNSKVSKSGDTMSGNLTIPAGTEAGHAVNKGQMDQAVANVIGSAPEALNALNELAAAMGNNPNFATTVSSQIGEKVSRAGDTMSGNLTIPNGTADGHAVNKSQLDGVVSNSSTAMNNKVSKGGDTMSGNLSIPNGTAEGHAVNKSQLDAAITANQQVNADWSATSGKALILNKPALSQVAISGSYNDLINKPNIITNQGSWIELSLANNLFATFAICRARKIGSIVYLEGHVQCNDVTDSENIWSPILILPEGYRPARASIRYGVVSGGINNTHLTIRINGQIALTAVGPERAFEVHLDGICFFID